jgi:hypothetical protein
MLTGLYITKQAWEESDERKELNIRLRLTRKLSESRIRLEQEVSRHA